MVMAMLIAWQTINAVRRRQSSRFTRGFLIVTPGLTIKDRLRVLQPSDPDSHYRDRELVSGDLLPDLDRAKIVITTTTPSGAGSASRSPRGAGHSSRAGDPRSTPLDRRARC